MPTVVLAGPVYGNPISHHVHAEPHRSLIRQREPAAAGAGAGAGGSASAPRPTPSTTSTVLDVVGTPVVALPAGVLIAIPTPGRGSGMSSKGIATSVWAPLPPITGILPVVADGGGGEQPLVDSGVGGPVADDAIAAIPGSGWSRHTSGCR